MNSDELQKHLSETWYRDQSADDAHNAIWGEPFDGYTVRVSEVEDMQPTLARHLERERDEAREELEDWRNAAKGAENPCPDEKHCTCVPLLRKLLQDAQAEIERLKNIEP